MNAITCCMVVFLVVHLFIRLSDCAKILAVEQIAAKSHWNFFSSVVKTLSTRHQVTVLTPYPEGSRENYTEIDTSRVFTHFFSMDAEYIVNNFKEPKIYFPKLIELTQEFCDNIKEIQRNHLPNGTNEFDLVISEPLLGDAPCSAELCNRFKIPQIYLIPSSMLTWKQRTYFGTVLNPSFVSNLFYSGVPKNFWQRFENTMMHVSTCFWSWYSEVKLLYRNWEKFEKSQDNPALVFTNTHYITEPARSFPKNMIQVGGIHLSANQPRALPTDILEFIENSPHGVICLTFGSIVSLSTLSDPIQKAFKDALAQVPQRILWKHEGEMKDKPANVMTSKWFPQRDILLHPNVKLFISHGGISGVYEAIDAGIPVLGFPLIYDQSRNIENLVDAGMAISMDLISVTTESFLSAVLELVNNENYSINAKITSERFKDRPMTPAESVIYWTEYVLLHKGASHLTSQAINLTWYQYLQMDVIAAIWILLFVIVYIIYRTWKVFLRFLLKYPNKSKLE